LKLNTKDFGGAKMTGLQLGIKELIPYKIGTMIRQDISFDLAASTHHIMQLRRKLKENIVEIGLELIKVKSNLDHGDWEDWVRNDLGWNPSTAWRFMNAARECNVNLAQAHDIDLEQFWGHKPRIPNRHSSEGEPRSIQDIERALTLKAQQLKEHTNNAIRLCNDIAYYADKLDWYLEYYTSLGIRDSFSLLSRLEENLQLIEEMSIDIQRKLNAIKRSKEIHIYDFGELKEKGIEQVKR
jgi:hypothetical protein